MPQRSLLLFTSFISVLLVIIVSVLGFFTWQQQLALRMMRTQFVAIAENSNVGAKILAPSTTLTSPSPTVTYLQTSTNTPTDLSSVKAEIGSLSARVAAVEKKLGVKPKVVNPSSNVKEVMIYLGTGGTDRRDWTDMTAAVADVNFDSYSKIKAVYFEAGLSIVGGEAHARLINLDTNSVFYETEVFNNSSSSVWKTAQVLVLPSGSTKLGVQVKSTSGEYASLDGSRLHIILE